MNEVRITGEMTPPTYSHKIGDQTFYTAVVTSLRKSGATDDIPIILPTYQPSGFVEVLGEFRSHNTPDRKLKLYLYPIQITYPTERQHINEIRLGGYVCKHPTTRTTPGGRIITDLLIAATRSNILDRSDYIPVVAWGGHLAEVKTRDYVELVGRVQSRTYGDYKVAYEVSAKTER